MAEKIRILSLNYLPMASRCPIGYVTDNLFSDERFDVTDFYVVPGDIYDKKFKSQRIVVNDIIIKFAKNFQHAENAVKKKECKGNKFVRSVKFLLKFMLPVYISNDVDRTIRRIKPHVIYSCGYDIRILKVAKKISKKYGVPISTHMLDNWFSDNKFIRYFQKRIMKQCMKDSDIHLSTSPSMSDFLKKEFSVNSVFVVNCCKVPEQCPEVSINDKDKVILGYLGNLTPNRHITLNKIIESINESDLRDRVKLRIYSPEHQSKMINKMDFVEVLPYVSQSEIYEVYKEIDIFLHVESFEKRDERFIKYSLSTKIAECFSLGKPLICTAPKHVGVSRFIEESGAGEVCETSEDSVKAIRKCICDEIFYNVIRKKQFECARRYFDTDAVRNSLYNYFYTNFVNPKVHYINFYSDEEVPERKGDIASRSKIKYIVGVLKRCNFTVNVASCAFSPSKKICSKEIIKRIDMQEKHIYLRTVNIPYVRRIVMKFFVLKYLLKNVKKNDVVIFYHSINFNNVIQIFKLLRKQRVLLEYNDRYGLHYNESRKVKRVERIEKSIVKSADGYILASPYMAELIEKQKPYIVNYGSYAPAAAICNDVPENIKIFGQEKKLKLVYTGVVESLRNAAFSVATMSEYLSDAIVGIAGYGTDSNINRLKQICETINKKCNEKKVEYLGCLNEQELSYLMSVADVAINAHMYSPDEIWKSKYSFPSKIPLNMSAGLHIITYPFDIIVYSPFSEACVYFEQFTKECLAEAVKRIQVEQPSKDKPRKIVQQLDVQFVSELKRLINEDK